MYSWITSNGDGRWGQRFDAERLGAGPREVMETEGGRTGPSPEETARQWQQRQGQLGRNGGNLTSPENKEVAGSY